MPSSNNVMQSFLRYFLGLSFALFCTSPGFAANFYVRAGAAGSNNGSDWNNAWTDVNRITWSSVRGGDTIWIAGGTYSQLSIGASGTAANRIYIKRVRTTNSVPASATGWNSSYDSRVVLNLVGCNSADNGNYVTLDGQVPYSGIVVTNTSLGETYAISLNASGANYLELFNLDIGGISTLTTSFSGEGRCLSANYSGTASGLHIAYCKFHGAPTLILTGGQHDMVFEYNKLYGNVVGNPAAWHPNVWNSIGNDVNVTFRYNDISEWMVEGIMMSTGTADSNWYIYGNVWHNDPSFTVSRVVEAQYTTHGPVYMYNNTFVSIAVVVSGGNGAWGWDSRCAAVNNIYFQAGNAGQGFGKGNDDYNLSNTSTTQPHGVGGATSSIFVNYAGGNFHIVTNIAAGYPRNRGLALGSPYSIDLDGTLRGSDGSWDIGAYEAGGVSVPSDTTPPTVSVTTPIGGVTISNLVVLTAIATDNVGGSGVAGVTFRVDGNNVGSVSSSPYTVNWDCRGVANGAHAITAVASDVAGNQGTSTAVNVTVANLVDTTAPTVNLTAPAGGTISNTVTLSASASDNAGGSGMSSVAFLVDGNAAGTISNAPYTMQWNSRNVANGTHTIAARARDVAGNQATSSGVTVNVQNGSLSVSNGLVGYWPFDDASGTTARDTSGNGNDGTLVGNAGWGTGTIVGGLSLNGGSGYVRVPSTVNLEKVTTAVTVCAWVKFGTNLAYAVGDMQSVARKVISETDNTAPYTSYDLVAQDAGGGTFRPRIAVTRASDSARGSCLGNAHAYGSWYHLAGVFDGTTLRIYVNGTEEANAAFSGTLLQTTQALCIGRYGTVADPVNGLIDDFRLYNRALSAVEVQTLYNTAAPPAPFGLKILSN